MSAEGRGDKGKGPTARSRALALVANRRRTERELECRLKKAGHSDAEISEAVEYLKGLKYIDDDSLADDLARDMSERRLFGPARIRAGLMARGIPKAVADRAAKASSRPAGQRDSARKALKKRFGRSSPEGSGAAGKRRAAQYLFRLGYGWDIIAQTIGDPGQAE